MLRLGASNTLEEKAEEKKMALAAVLGRTSPLPSIIVTSEERKGKLA
ncbi:hypothetical protein [Coxiella-like endosymbiont]|nr:hypothetical protein [Coxiella-like endosymbiont]